jgi:hypothetical protein
VFLGNFFGSNDHLRGLVRRLLRFHLHYHLIFFLGASILERALSILCKDHLRARHRIVALNSGGILLLSNGYIELDRGALDLRLGRRIMLWRWRKGGGWNREGRRNGLRRLYGLG